MGEVSHRVGCSKASVCRWKQALAQSGAEALTASPRPGAAQTPGGAMPAIVGVVAERGRCLRLPQRTMDVGSHRRGDCAGVRCILSSQSCMAAASSTLLVLPGSGVAGHAARRGRHRPLEALPLAAYKKRLANLGPIWPSWMKAAFCSSPRRRRTWGPQGQPPVVHYNYRHDRICAGDSYHQPGPQAGLCLCLSSGRELQGARGARPAEPAATYARPGHSFVGPGPNP